MKWVHLLTFAALLVLPGCGKESARLSIYGTITLDGDPVETGVITLKPAEGTKAPLVGGEFTRGTYKIAAANGPIEGKYRVEIRSPEESHEEVVVYPGAPPGFKTIETIPEAYNTKSKLEIEVSKGSQEHNFDLISSSKSAAENQKK